MFENIGGKIKGLAQILCYMGILGTIIIGFLCVYAGMTEGIPNSVFMGLLYIVLGPIFSWVGSFFMYGFGTLIENSEEQIEILNEISDKLDDSKKL